MTSSDIPSCPYVDKLIAVIGNGGALTAWLIEPSHLTAIGGVLVSLATVAYFVARTLHERQKMRQEQEMHELKVMEAISGDELECPECGEATATGQKHCGNCGAGLGH